MAQGGLELWVFVGALAVLLVASAAQAALVYIDRARLRHMLEAGTPRARALIEMVDSSSTSLTTVLLVHTIAIAMATASAFRLVELSWAQQPLGGAVVALAGIVLLMLIQFIGRLVAVSRPESVGLALVRPVELLTRGLAPVVLPLMALERWSSRVLGLRRSTTPAEAEDRLMHLVEDNAELEENEREMIASVIELGDQPVREVMVPRMDIVALPGSASVVEVLDRIVASGHSRIPLYRQGIDNVVGVVYAKDLLKHLRSGSMADPAAPLAREPFFVPETKRVDDLLHEMRQRGTHLAVVLDEYGGTAGLISIEDLIEEIVGEIHDEYDTEEAFINQVSPTEAIFDGRVSIRDLNDTLDLEIDDEDFDTLGGLVYHQLGKVPTAGDEVRVDGCVVTVLSTDGRRVKKVRVVKVGPTTHVIREQD